MGKPKDTNKEPTIIIEEIEGQLGEALAKKKEEIEKELEERIRREKEEAQKRIELIEKEFEEEKKALKSYRDTIKEFENNKGKLKVQIKEHLDKAIKFQTEIEKLTAQTLEELKEVSELNQKLDELNKEAEEKAAALKKELEDRFGIVAEVMKANEHRDLEVNLEQELAKLRKIKELLTTPEMAEEEKIEELSEVVEEKVEEEVLEEKQAKEERKPSEEVKAEEAPPTGNEEGQGFKPYVAEKEKEAGAKEMELVEPFPSEAEEEEPHVSEKTFQDAFETLENYRKSEQTEDNGEISYFQKNEKMILDGESLISALSNGLDEAKKLYLKLAETESPKDQFFIKQEIIRYQESLRKTILHSVRMCQKENCSLPKYTKEIINTDVLKDILEKLSMENWSNQDDFTHFEKYAKNLKNNYYTRITPPALYLKSIIDELNI